MDIRPPKKRPLSSHVPQNIQHVAPPVVPPPAPIAPQPQTPPSLVPKRKRRLWTWITGGIIAVLLLIAGGSVVWYKLSLRAVDASDTSRIRLTITEGQSPSQIAQALQDKKLIRSQVAFDVYTRLTGARSQLRAGTYSISPSESTETIVSNLVSGKVDQFNITFLPGATVAEDKQVLVKAGYKQSDVDAAFSKQYDHPLFATKPATADLEGYIYGETYNFDSDTTVEQILAKTFDEYYAAVTDNDLVAGFQKQGLTLYQGITLASIVQREVSNATDQKQVAQIFLKRLQIGIPLGSDVTYHYAAQKLGVDPSPTLDSPYNTRIYKGLPPGPIAAPGLGALKAVANPASGDYLYFLSGDDGTTYYATTEAEHQANITNHCQIKCATP
ncbi:MAG TPA: endolytic transglycosylase MltG [Candidatus Chromulinivoraceae bacterium]|nr:endolytic transglycosylase MltG [Candidatus Chromulinivoraceae bacterium]